ncbi:MAG: hypothetical protein ABSG67_19080 [Thermoguttaceae bacterium]|jgi:hypothetical protein
MKFPQGSSTPIFFGGGPYLAAPWGVAVSHTGEIYVSDNTTNNIQKWFDLDAWVSGTPHFDNAYIGAGQMLGQSLTLDSTKGLISDGNLDMHISGSLIQQGSNVTTGILQNWGATDVQSSSNLYVQDYLMNYSTGIFTISGTVNIRMSILDAVAMVIDHQNKNPQVQTS